MSVIRRLAALTAIGLAALVAPAGPSEAAGDFSATAAADGIRVGVAMPGFLIVEQFVDAGMPSAQAHVDSLGNSRAWAANPFPGDVVVSAPGTVAGFGPPGLPSLPQYPFIVTATHPTQGSGEVSAPGFALRSRADEEAASGVAEAGIASEEATAGLVRALADVRRDAGGKVRATGRSTVEAFTAGDVLRIGRVESHAVAEADPGGTVAREADTTFAEVTVAGQPVILDEDGLTLPGGGSPLPDTEAVRAVLTDAGMSVRYLAPEETDDGVIAAGVEVSLVREVPSVGTGVVTYVLGRASAAASAHADPVAGFGPGTDPVDRPPAVPPPAEAEAPASRPMAENTPAAPEPARPLAPLAPVASPGATPAARTFTPVVPPSDAPESLLPDGNEGDGDGGTVAAPAEPPAARLDRPAPAVAGGPDFSGFAPVLLAGGVVIVGALLATHRALGRASWTS